MVAKSAGSRQNARRATSQRPTSDASSAGKRQIQVRERAKRVRVVGRQLAGRLPQEQRIQCQGREDHGEDGRCPANDLHADRRISGRHDESRDSSRGCQPEHGVLPRGQVADEDNRKVRVRAHRTEQIQRRKRGDRREDNQKRHLRSLSVERRQRDSGRDTRDPEDSVEPQEKQQPEQHPGNRRKEAVAVDVCPRVRQERGKEQRLHDHLGVRVPGEPHLDDVKGQQTACCRGRRSSDQPRSREVERQQPKQGPDPHGPECARQSIDAVANRNRRGKQVRELADDGPAAGILDEEAHEPRAVVVLSLMRRKKQVARKGRHGGDDRIPNHQGSTLRDLNPFVHVGARILPADRHTRTTGRTARGRGARAQPE